MIRSVTVVLASLAVSWGTAASAQTKLAVQPGKEVRIGTYGGFNKDCSPGALHEIKITSPPKSGSLVVKTATLKSSASSACPNKDGPAQQVFYQAKDGFTGSETVGYQVKNPAGQTQSVTATITVAR